MNRSLTWGVVRPPVAVVHGHASSRRTLQRYWSIYDVAESEVPELVAECFTAGAVFESASLPSPLVGHSAIVDRVIEIRDLVRAATVRYDGPVEWVHATARWRWSWTGPGGDAAGTDVAGYADDGRIERLVVLVRHARSRATTASVQRRRAAASSLFSMSMVRPPAFR